MKRILEDEGIELLKDAGRYFLQYDAGAHMVKKKRIVIRIAFCDFALWNSDHRNLGLVFPKFLFFWAEWNV